MPSETFNYVRMAFILSGTEIPNIEASQTSFGFPPEAILEWLKYTLKTSLSCCEPFPRSALKEPSFLQRTIFIFATEGTICEKSKRTGAPNLFQIFIWIRNKGLLILLLRRRQNQGNNRYQFMIWVNKRYLCRKQRC